MLKNNIGLSLAYSILVATITVIAGRQCQQEKLAGICDYRSSMRSLVAALVFAFFPFLVSGCANSRYSAAKNESGVELHSNVITFGQPNEKLDKAEHVLMSPKRWVQGLRKDTDAVVPPYVREHVSDTVTQYIAANELSGINIDVDVYQPRLQWQRLKSAEHVGPIAKYTLGTFSLLREAILPARMFNQDRYNHYTKTLSLNSHDETSALFESAMVKEHLNAPFTPLATVLQRLPIGTTIARARAGSDSLTWARTEGNSELESELYPFIYSSVVSEALGDIGVLTDLPINFPERIVARLGARQLGKAVGSYQTKSR